MGGGELLPSNSCCKWDNCELEEMRTENLRMEEESGCFDKTLSLFRISLEEMFYFTKSFLSKSIILCVQLGVYRSGEPTAPVCLPQPVSFCVFLSHPHRVYTASGCPDRLSEQVKMWKNDRERKTGMELLNLKRYNIEHHFKAHRKTGTWLHLCLLPPPTIYKRLLEYYFLHKTFRLTKTSSSVDCQ